MFAFPFNSTTVATIYFLFNFGNTIQLWPSEIFYSRKNKTTFQRVVTEMMMMMICVKS